MFAMTEDNELAFSLPACKIESFMEGVVATHKGGVARIPAPVGGINYEPEWPACYGELSKYADSAE